MPSPRSCQNGQLYLSFGSGCYSDDCQPASERTARSCGTGLGFRAHLGFVGFFPSSYNVFGKAAPAEKCVVVLLSPGYAQDDGGWSSFVSIWVKKTPWLGGGGGGAVSPCTARGSWGRKSRSRNDGSGCTQVASLRKGSAPDIQNCLPQNHS